MKLEFVADVALVAAAALAVGSFAVVLVAAVVVAELAVAVVELVADSFVEALVVGLGFVGNRHQRYRLSNQAFAFQSL